MDDDPQLMDTLLQRWRTLPAGDRTGVLRRLSDDQRGTFQRLLAASDRERAELAARAQRFHPYSPWLGSLLEACEEGGPLAAQVKPAVCAALLAGHEKAAASGARPEAPASLAAVVQSFVRSLRTRP